MPSIVWMSWMPSPSIQYYYWQKCVVLRLIKCCDLGIFHLYFHLIFIYANQTFHQFTKCIGIDSPVSKNEDRSPGRWLQGNSMQLRNL